MRNKFFSLQTLKVLFYLSFFVLRLRKIIVLTPIILLFPVIKFRFIHLCVYPLTLQQRIHTVPVYIFTKIYLMLKYPESVSVNWGLGWDFVNEYVLLSSSTAYSGSLLFPLKVSVEVEVANDW